MLCRVRRLENGCHSAAIRSEIKALEFHEGVDQAEAREMWWSYARGRASESSGERIRLPLALPTKLRCGAVFFI
jgi:hypothetical protein